MKGDIMSEKHIKIKIGPTVDLGNDFDAIVDVETGGRLFYEEVFPKHAERFVKCWNSHDALLAACDEGLHECERAKMHCTCKHKDLGGLLKRIERIEAAIALTKEEG